MEQSSLRVGDFIYGFRNQAYREMAIRAIIDNSALVEYRMPNGRCFLNVVDLSQSQRIEQTSLPAGQRSRPSFDVYKTFDYKKMPQKWVDAMQKLENSKTLFAFPGKREYPVYSSFFRGRIRDSKTGEYRTPTIEDTLRYIAYHNTIVNQFINWDADVESDIY